MEISDGLIDKWAGEAMNDLGEKGWRDVDGNGMMLVIYAMQKSENKKQAARITKPFWWLLAAICPGVLWYIISGVIPKIG